MSNPYDFSRYSVRRRMLASRVQKEYGIDKGLILIIGGFEGERYGFQQDSSFYYFTGLHQPGFIFVQDLNGRSTLFVPVYGINRSVWVNESDIRVGENSSENENMGFNSIEPLGAPLPGFSITPLVSGDYYTHVTEFLKHKIKEGYELCTSVPVAHSSHAYAHEIILKKLQHGISVDGNKVFKNISPVVAALRRKKDEHEITEIRRAGLVTMEAHRIAAECIRPGSTELDVKAELESIMTKYGSCPAFPSIVAAGKNSTVLHYTPSNHKIMDNDLVVVDIGAQSGGYAADVTRTYAASGTYNPRQKVIYEMVKEAQQYIASLAAPGYWLKNSRYPEQSLHHLTVEFFKKKGDYDKYFPHGVGHYLGLDVHDVGSYELPLEPGDVITIEPGLYSRDEGIGVRIEDDFLITLQGVECLTDSGALLQ